MSLLQLVERRLVIVTGKGGVGKTTLSVAMAQAWARRGRRVLLSEITPSAETPSQLARVLPGLEPMEEPREVEKNLSVALLTPSAGHRRFLQDALPIRLLADAAMRSTALRKFLSAAPGFSDMGVMYRMLDLLRRTDDLDRPRYDIAVVDSPATGHALALAQIPEFLTRVIPAGPIYRAASEGVRILTDASTTGCVVVTLPELLPVTEAMELEQGLGRHGLTVSAFVVNRVPADPFTPEERAQVGELLDGRPVLGARELGRIDRARSALDLLRQKHPHRAIVLPEAEPPRVAERLAALL